jgi:two-component system cell cycle sensor histidine kinase/response regulator CckA
MSTGTGNGTKGKIVQEPGNELDALRQQVAAFAASEQKLKQLEGLVRIQQDLAMALNSVTTLGAAGRKIVEAALQFEGVDCGAVYIVDQDSGGLDLIAQQGFSPEFSRAAAHFDADSFQTRMVTTGKPIYKSYVRTILTLDDRVIKQEALLASAIIPLTYENRVKGSLNLYSRTRQEFPAGIPEAMEAIAVQVGGVIGRRKTEETLKKDEEQYRQFLQTSGDAVYLMYNGKLEIVNDAFQKLFGLSRQEINVPEFDFRQLVTAKSRSIIDARNQKLTAGEKLDPHYEYTVLSTGGREIPVEECITYIHYKDGLGIQGIIRDVSRQKDLEQQLRQAQKLEAVGKLAGGMAHDFNNMLQAISGYVQLVQKGGKPQQAQKYLGEINRVIGRAADLVERLLTFVRVTDNKLRPVDLNQQIEQAVKILARTIPRMIRIETKLAPDLWLTNGDGNQLEQVLLNLGTNARDAMPEGGHITIETGNISLDQPDDSHPGIEPGEYILLSFADTGTGMKDEAMTRMFDPFYTTKTMGKGTGLGLTMVQSIVAAHRGKITCRSRPGTGTTFKIYLPPLKTSKADERPKAAAPEKTTGGRETILLVDDEVDILEVGKEILEEYGYTTLTAENGEEALEIFKEKREQIDLVILDINMPTMSGHTCMKELLKLNPDIKIIIASGYLIKDQISESLKAGATEFMVKPFRLEEMLSTVRKILDGEPAGPQS